MHACASAREKVAAKLQLIYETTKFFASFCAFSGHFCFILAQKAKKSRFSQPKAAFLPNTRSVLTKRNERSYQTLSAFLQYCNPVPTKLFYKPVEFGNQSRRVWSSRQSELHHKQVSTMLQFRLNNDMSPYENSNITF